MLIIAKPHITFFNPQKNNVRKGIKLFFFLLIINSVFAFWEYDTYHYWEAFTIAGFYKQYVVTEYEQFYNWLAGFVHNNYFLWRTCIFVPACLFMYYTAKRLNLLNRNLLVAIVLFGAFLSVTRGMLGHAMLVFGLVLFLTSKKSTKFIAFLIICASYFLHKSMYINLIFALLAIIPFRKKGIILSFIAFPFLIILATYLIDNIISGQLNITLSDGVGGTSNRTLDYASSEKMELNTLGIIGKIIGMIPQYLALFYLCRRYMQNRIGGGQNVYAYLFKLTYVAIYIASLFLFVETSSWIYERFKYMCFFPMVFVLAKAWSNETHSNKWVKWIIVLQMMSVVLMLTYRLHEWHGL